MIVLTYENVLIKTSIIKALQEHLEEGEFIVHRGPFRWRTVPDEVTVETIRDGHVIENAYEMFEIEGICEDRGWELVHDFHHIAVIKKERPE